jgi:hypothetical protein
MKGQSCQGRRIVVLFFAFFVLQVQSWKTPAPFVDLTYFSVTFFVRTSPTGGLVVTRGFNSQGPLDKQRFFTGVRLVPTQEGVANEWLGIEGNNVIRVRANGEATIETGPADLNNLPAAVAFDMGQGRAFAASNAGEGFLFQEPANQPWSLLSGMNNIHFVAMGYFADDAGDGIWGLRRYENAPSASAVFTKFSTNGVKLEDFTTNGFPVNIGPGEYACEIFQDGSFAGTHLLVAKPYTVALSPGDISRIYSFDPTRGYLTLLFENSYAPQAPSVRFTNPDSSSEVLTLGSPFDFRLEVYDPDNDLQSVELLDNGAVFKEWTIAAQPYATTNMLFQSWTAGGEGSHTITARARDAGGLITEKSVTIDVVKVKVERAFPVTRIFAGQTISVSLTAWPAGGTSPWTLKERPPADWTISPGTQGTLDPVSHEITWGPFSDSAQRTLTYSVTGPSSSSLSNFEGDVSVNGTSTPIVGASSLELIPPSAPTVRFVNINNSQLQTVPGNGVGVYIEASDADGDLRSAEIRRDGALLDHWDLTPVWEYQVVPLATSWTANAAGHYTLTAHVEDSLGNVAEKSTTLDVIFASGVAVSRNLPTNVIAGQSFTVSLSVFPGGSAPSWIIKEQPPAGWKVSAGADASIDPSTHEIGWGPFDDSQIQRTLTYEITAPIGATDGSFDGQVLIGGVSNPISGRTATHVLPPTQTSVQWVDPQHVTINFNAFPGIGFVIESADSINSSSWTPITSVLGGDMPIQLGPIEIPNQQKFFRLRPF